MSEARSGQGGVQGQTFGIRWVDVGREAVSAWEAESCGRRAWKGGTPMSRPGELLCESLAEPPCSSATRPDLLS